MEKSLKSSGNTGSRKQCQEHGIDRDSKGRHINVSLGRHFVYYIFPLFKEKNTLEMLSECQKAMSAEKDCGFNDVQRRFRQ